MASAGVKSRKLQHEQNQGVHSMLTALLKQKGEGDANKK